MIGPVQWGTSDHPFKAGALEVMLDPEFTARRLNAVIDQLHSGMVPPTQIYNMLYQDLVNSTIPTLESMYRHFGITLSDDGRYDMARYVAENPRDARPSHRVNLGSDEMISRQRRAYNRYQNYFGVPNE